MKISLLKSGCVAILCALFIGFYACTGEEVFVSDNKNESPYERMGRLHNEGLNYVLGKIVNTSPLTKSGGREIPKITEIQRMCDDFARSKGYAVATKSIDDDREFFEDFSFLSELQQEWLGQIKEIVWTLTPENAEEFIITMKSLERQLEMDIKICEQEKEILFYTMSVCCYSARYWKENYEKWLVELLGVDKVSTRSVKTKSEDGIYVSKEWWETYKYTVWADGSGGIQSGDGYRLESATAESVKDCLKHL